MSCPKHQAVSSIPGGIKVIFFLLLLVLGGHTSIQLGLDIPVTGQSLVVLLIGYYLSMFEISILYLIYLGGGALGLSLWADGASGYEHLLGKSGGYLYSFYFSSLFISYTKRSEFHFLRLTGLFTLATVFILLIGMLHLSLHIGIAAAFLYGVMPYILGAAIKILAAVAIIYGVLKVKELIS